MNHANTTQALIDSSRTNALYSVTYTIGGESFLISVVAKWADCAERKVARLVRDAQDITARFVSIVK